MHDTSNRLRRLHRAIAATCVATTMLTACGGGGDDPVQPQPTLRIAVAPTPLSIAQGAAGNATATITRGGNFAGAVGLVVNGAPAGITVTATPTSIAAGATTAQLAVSVAGSVAAGSYPVRVVASGSGVATDSATLTIGVTAAAAGSVSLAAAPTSLTMVAGAAAQTSTLTITRGAPFTGAVALAAATAAGAPAGLTASVTPNANVTGTSATLSVQAAAGTAAGTYNVTVTATGTGIPAATATIPVTVQAPPVVTGTPVAFCAADAPIWLAVQDGTGAWTRQTPTSGATYNVAFPSGRGGIAYVDTSGTRFELRVIYLTTADLGNYARGVNFANCQNKTLTGSVAGVAAGQLANVSLGYATTIATAPTTTFTLQNVSDGPQDLIATRTNAVSQRVDRVILRRGLNLANNATIPVLDFGAAEAFAPVPLNVTVTGGGGGTRFVSTAYVGQAGSAQGTIGQLTNLVAGAQPIDALPVAQLQSGEFQRIVAFESSGGGGNTFRSIQRYFRAPSDVSLALPPAVATPTVTTAATAPYQRPRTVVALQPEYNRVLSVQYEQSNGNDASVFVTSGYAGTITNWDVTLPDLSSVAGWLNTWGLVTGTPFRWTVIAFGGTSLGFDQITDGATQTFGATSSSP
ncbi:MAG: hypothetical protein MUF21_01215 [Gemmatimonadaceae bacterium]|nr:hypothetical protein [Gemmatimonadaceae bacterium]